jgi:hypothetical protein
MSTQPELCRCSSCGATHVVQRLRLSSRHDGALDCPACGDALVRWSGPYFYTLGIDPPKSSAEMDVMDPGEESN